MRSRQRYPQRIYKPTHNLTQNAYRGNPRVTDRSSRRFLTLLECSPLEAVDEVLRPGREGVMVVF